MKTVTLINPFSVGKDKELEFLNAWCAVDDYMHQQEGFIETKLHRLLEDDGLGLSKFQYINVALWKTKECFLNAAQTETFRRIVTKVHQYSAGPGLYDLVVT